jgi:hypothetical protein
MHFSKRRLAEVDLLGFGIVVFDFCDGRKRYFNDLAVWAFHLHTRRSQCLCSFHAADSAANSFAIHRNNLNVSFTVKRL